MPTACIYVSIHGHTRQVARTLDLPKYNLSLDQPDLDNYTTIIILCPTYGDGELPLVMEQFIEEVEGKKMFAVCELGNYYGYEDKSFGAAKIIRDRLFEKGWVEIVRPLSLDSLPKIDWESWGMWKDQLSDYLSTSSAHANNASPIFAI